MASGTRWAALPDRGAAKSSIAKAIGRRASWVVILVPFAFAAILFATEYCVHSFPFKFFQGVGRSQGSKPTEWVAHGPDKALIYPRSLPPSLSPTPTSVVSTIPTLPSTPPVLPIPFPQPIDTDLIHSFPSSSCFAFFSNMTISPDFLSCRPLSFLIGASSFINAQSNLTMLNTVLWATCHTDPPKYQCSANMEWFATALQSSCKKELDEKNPVFLNILVGLQNYSLMRDVGCLIDPVLNTYCYIDAIRDTSHSNILFYSLPFNANLSLTMAPSCSSCTKSLLFLYDASLRDPDQAPRHTRLQKAYNRTAQLAVNQCGSRYATTQMTSRAASTRRSGSKLTAFLLFGVLLEAFVDILGFCKWLLPLC